MTAVGWPVELSHGNVGLRPLRARDAKRWAELRAQHTTWLKQWEASLPADSGRPSMSYREMISLLRARAKKGEGMPFAVTVDGEMVGQVTVNQITGGSSRSANIGYWIAESHAGKGVITTAVALACDHLLRVLSLHRIEIAVRPENGASLRVVEKLGFTEIGLAPNYLHINGQWRDHLIFQLLREDVETTVLARARH